MPTLEKLETDKISAQIDGVLNGSMLQLFVSVLQLFDADDVLVVANPLEGEFLSL